MDAIPSGLTWTEIIERFNADAEFTLLLNQRPRRTSKHKRRQGIPEERRLWRLILQRNANGQRRTILRKNLRGADEPLMTQKATDAQVALLNSLICQG